MFIIEKRHEESEFDTQAELWWGLRSKGVHVRGEVRGKTYNGKKVRLDVVAFDQHGDPSVVFETKIRRRDRWKVAYEGVAQYNCYRGLQLPAIIVCGVDEARAAVEEFEELRRLPGGIHWLRPPKR